MSFVVNHVHLKTRDPSATAKFYMENFWRHHEVGNTRPLTCSSISMGCS